MNNKRKDLGFITSYIYSFAKKLESYSSYSILFKQTFRIVMDNQLENYKNVRL